MSTRARRRFYVVGRALGVGAFLLARDASAGDKEVCIDAHEHSQIARRDGRLLQAQRDLATCSRTECPPVVEAECAGWMSEVEASVPTLLIRAKGPDGREIVEVSVAVDGVAVLARLDGPAVPVDPGDHVLRLQTRDGRFVEQTVAVRPGEKGRRVDVELPAPPPPMAPSPAPTAAPMLPRSPPPDTSTPTSAYVLGAVGVAGLGVFGAFAIAGKLQQSSLDDNRCKLGRTCPEGDVDAMYRDYLIADVALAVGVVALGAATVLFLTRPRAKPTAAMLSLPSGRISF